MRIADFSLLFMKYQGIYFMKKTLIALVVAAGATMSVSGVANAFTSAFPGGDISLGGTISTPVQGAVYEGKVGSLTGLDSNIPVGDTTVSIVAPANAGLLALRSVQGGFDNSASDKIANITFNGKTLVQAAGGSFSNGAIDMTLDVQDATGNKIGDITFPMQVAAVSAIVDNADSSVAGASLYAYDNSRTYYGALPQKAAGAVSSYSDALSIMNGLFSDISDYLPQVTSEASTAEAKDFSATGKVFNTAYAAGIVAGNTITLTLDNPATAGDVSWTASMPVVVSYK
ncbi:hypothetical protein [Escherichia coli]|uniref:F4 family fimbrial subunit n=1 Tax=Escherichia coli TaxID=562 RepID=UPI0031B5ECBC